MSIDPVGHPFCLSIVRPAELNLFGGVTLDTYADSFDTDLDAVASVLDLKCAHSVPKGVPTAVQLA